MAESAMNSNQETDDVEDDNKNDEPSADEDEDEEDEDEKEDPYDNHFGTEIAAPMKKSHWDKHATKYVTAIMFMSIIACGITSALSLYLAGLDSRRLSTFNWENFKRYTWTLEPWNYTKPNP